MKADKTEDLLRLVNEPGDSPMELELKANLNGLLDALKLFYQHGIAVKVKRAPKGYTLELKK